MIGSVSQKLFRIDDSPFRIALGFGLGVFAGVMPGVGPVAALALAFLFRVNRASALLGSLLFNTWFGFIILLLAVKLGAAVVGLDPEVVHKGWETLFADLSWSNLFRASALQVLVPIGLGYLLISLCLGAVMTAVVFVIAKRRKSEH